MYLRRGTTKKRGAKMTVWIKQGVIGDLTIMAQKCLGRIAKLYSPDDLFVTSIRDGKHIAGSLHYSGNAFDFRKSTYDKIEIRHAAGVGFDVVMHRTHVHIEYDPKK